MFGKILRRVTKPPEPISDYSRERGSDCSSAGSPPSEAGVGFQPPTILICLNVTNVPFETNENDLFTLVHVFSVMFGILALEKAINNYHFQPLLQGIYLEPGGFDAQRITRFG